MDNVFFMLDVAQKEVNLFWTRTVTTVRTGFFCLSLPDFHQAYYCPEQSVSPHTN